MKLRLTPIAFALLALLAPRAVAAQSAAASPDVDATLPEPSLTPAPRLVPPVLTPPTLPSTSGPPKPTPSSRAPATAPPTDTGTIFMRADRIEGAGEKAIEASGKVELRTRRETVLADWLRYDFANDEIWGKGDVRIRYGIDWITGPELKFKRGTETGFFTTPHFFVGENGGRGSASEIRFAGPDHYEASNARYTTCVAPREDWYLRMDELEVDKSRMVGTGHNATVYFFGAPGHLFAMVRVSAVERAQVGVPDADDGADRHPRLRILAAVLPQSRAQLRCDDHAAAHDQARHTVERHGALPVRHRARRGRRGIPAKRPCDRHDPVPAVVAAHAESRFRPARPRRLLEPQQGVRRHVLLRSVRPRRSHIADDAAARRRIRLYPRAVGGARPRAGLPDAAGPDGTAARSPTTACRRGS